MRVSMSGHHGDSTKDRNVVQTSRTRGKHLESGKSLHPKSCWEQGNSRGKWTWKANRVLPRVGGPGWGEPKYQTSLWLGGRSGERVVSLLDKLSSNTAESESHLHAHRCVWAQERLHRASDTGTFLDEYEAVHTCSGDAMRILLAITIRSRPGKSLSRWMCFWNLEGRGWKFYYHKRLTDRWSTTDFYTRPIKR